MQQRQAQLEAAQVNLDYTDIVSPVDGTVVSRNVTVGQTVAASFQTPTLFLIATDLTKMQVDTNVSESDIGGIKDWDKAAFTVDAFPKRTFEGTVSQVRQSPQTVQNVVTYDVVVSIDNADLALKPGMTAANRIITDERTDVLRVPSQALRYAPADRSGPRSGAPFQRGRPDTGLGTARRQAGAGRGDRRARRRHLHRNRQRRVEGRRPGHHRRATHRHQQQGGGATPADVTRPKAGESTMAEPIIRLEHVARTYHVGDVDVHALRDVTLTINAGEFVAIMGASGSGKSTLMAVLGCLDRPSSGSYFFEGADVANFGEPERARLRSERLGFVFQSFNLLSRTSALENVALPLFYAASGPAGAASRVERARASLKLLGLGDRERNTPGQLSGGQQQRVAIARALINAPGSAARRRADRQSRYPHLARNHGNAGAAQSRARRHRHRRHP